MSSLAEMAKLLSEIKYLELLVLSRDLLGGLSFPQ